MGIWIEPLALKTWIVDVLSGDTQIFLALALFFIFTMSAFFRMTATTTFLMLGVFVLMFTTWVPQYFILIIATIGGLLIGSVLSQIWKR